VLSIRHSCRTQEGYTLIELMVVTVMVAVLAMIAAPSFNNTVLQSKRQSALEDTFNMLRKARGEAAAKSADTVVCASDDASTCSDANEWEAGWIVFLDNGSGGGTAGDGVRDANEPLVRIGDGAPVGITVRAVNFDNASRVGFSPQGVASGRGTFQICDKRGSAQAAAVILNKSGQPRLGLDEDGDGAVNTDGGAGNNVSCPGA
jgi:type IV fimbrial biogenesis protein FimT